jgi:hypothetical protein
LPGVDHIIVAQTIQGLLKAFPCPLWIRRVGQLTVGCEHAGVVKQLVDVVKQLVDVSPQVLSRAVGIDSEVERQVLRESLLGLLAVGVVFECFLCKQAAPST